MISRRARCSRRYGDGDGGGDSENWREILIRGVGGNVVILCYNRFDVTFIKLRIHR